MGGGIARAWQPTLVEMGCLATNPTIINLLPLTNNFLKMILFAKKKKKINIAMLITFAKLYISKYFEKKFQNLLMYMMRNFECEIKLSVLK